MREVLLKKGLDRLEKHTPKKLAMFEIQVLADITARGFGVPRKKIPGRSPERALREYALFTKACCETVEADPERLYEEAYKAGSRIRKLTGVKDSNDCARLVFYLYRNIYITMSGRIPGEITVSDCYFGRIYTPGHCRIMSNVDSGIIAGISGGGKLEFTERITEGCKRCRAEFKGGETDE